MYHNWHFLSRLAQALNEQLKGLQIMECFSQNKDELIIGLTSPVAQYYIRADLTPQVSLLQVSNDFKRARKNSINLFETTLNSRVSSVKAFENERSFYLHLDQGYLVFKMHGKRSNILLLDAEGEPKDVFKHNLSNDLQLRFQDLKQPLDLSYDRFKELSGELQKFNPSLGKEMAEQLLAMGYAEAGISSQWDMLQSMLKQVHTSPIFIYQEDSKLPKLSLLKLDQPVISEMNDPLEANNTYFSTYTRAYYLYKEQSKHIRPLESQIKKTENYLKKTRQKLDEVGNKRGHDEIANIIMANLHAIKGGASSATLYDFYHDQQITIKLSPETTPQKFAENLYRKSKNHQKEIDQLQNNIATREKELTSLQAKLQSVQASDSIKEMRKHGPERKAKEKEIILPYYKHEYRGYQILVGRSSKHNDELTLKIANKDDLWLHAKDVPGSHVVIRQQPGKAFPNDVIEKAAELAAWNSKRKTDSLCPVIYTPKKYVRKRKGDPPGAVVVEREKVLMVQPKA